MRDKRLLTLGVFDLFHAGHVYFLKNASAHGKVIVAVADDESIKVLKNPNRPIYPLEDRIELLESCKYVHAVIPFSYGDDMNTAHRNLLTETEYDAFVQGEQANHVHLYPILKALNVPILTVASRTEVSTSDIIKKIREIV